MNVAILTIGDEVVTGKIINTNASMLAKVFETNHFNVIKHLAVIDGEKEITEALKLLYQDADIVVTTGGLGPTDDDMTKAVSAGYFNEKLVFFPDVYDKINTYFLSSGRIMTENNRKQAYFIQNSIVIENNNGTAPGMIYTKGNKVIINLPGPPKELEPMLYTTVLPFLKQYGDKIGFKRHYRLIGIGESHADTVIRPLYEKYPRIKICSYASVGYIDYLLSTLNNDEESFLSCCSEFERYLGKFIIGDWEKTLEEIIVDTLSRRKLIMAVAESCTGGMLASLIVDVPGSSAVLTEALVTYSNEAKTRRLGVKEETLKTYGAVSKETAEEMALLVKETSQADIGLSITGIAGPTGGTANKPVGLVYSAIHYNGKTHVFEKRFLGDRYKIRRRAVIQLLFELYQLLKTN